jgi:hypothetical protein
MEKRESSVKVVVARTKHRVEPEVTEKSGESGEKGVEWTAEVDIRD